MLFRPRSDALSHQIRVALVFACAIALAMAFVDVPVALMAETHSAALHWIMRKLSALGDSGWSIPLAIISTLAALVVAIIRPGRQVLVWRNASLFVLLNLCISGLSCVFLKSVVGRLRPGFHDLHQNLIFSPFTHGARWTSFPSGHTTTAMSLALSLALIFPRLREPLIVTAVLVGVSRVVLGIHWVSDTIAGAGLAYATVTIIAACLPGLLAPAELRPARG